MPNGAMASATIVAGPSLAGSITNTATVSASSASPSTNTTVSVVTTVIQNPARPMLELAQIGNSVVFFWSTNATGYNLESTTGLAPTGPWSSVTNVPVVVGGMCYVTNAITGPSKFYRLSN
jgi:hypothetical protein